MTDSYFHIDRILSEHRQSLGKDNNSYLGHCMRIMKYMLALGMQKEEEEVASVLVAFHDLGIWTHHTMDYLEPSVQLALEYLEKEQLSIAPEVAQQVIGGHHKISVTSNPLAEKLRKADLVDLSMGLIRFGIPKSVINRTVKEHPYLGFQYMITRKVLGHAFRNPLKPFPMMKT